MLYRVKLFAALRDRAGRDTWTIESDRALTGTDLLKAFFASFPELEGLRAATRLAVNQAFCVGDPRLSESDEIALIPPVSGG